MESWWIGKKHNLDPSDRSLTELSELFHINIPLILPCVHYLDVQHRVDRPALAWQPYAILVGVLTLAYRGR